ncbi:MAG TPA: GreA/GreB family elongation factor [Ktedonobacterales bacterium]|nr:GreA/GreB family elongation factor [Ktedonobacterales bacterium]
MELNLDHLEDQRARLIQQILDAEEARDSAGHVAVAQFDDHRERVNAELAQLRQQLTWLEKEIGQAKSLQHPVAQDAIEVGHVITLQIGESGPSDYVLVKDFGGRAVGEAKTLSTQSPIGAALLGRTSGEVVTVETPGGMRTIKIVAVQ